MSRYIDADVFDERIRISVGLVEEELTEDYKDGVRCTLEMLEIQPTADVVPMAFYERCMELEIKKRANMVERKQGKWIDDRICSTSGGTYGVHRCSVCKEYFQDIGYGWNYCPNCGADMRGEEDE